MSVSLGSQHQSDPVLTHRNSFEASSPSLELAPTKDSICQDHVLHSEHGFHLPKDRMTCFPHVDLDPYRIMGVHDNLVLFLKILDNRFFPDKGFNFGRVVYSIQQSGNHHYALLGIQLWTLFDGDIVCNDWGGSAQSLR